MSSNDASSNGGSDRLPPGMRKSGWSPYRIRQFRAQLRAFFRESARPLPWRSNPDPYATLVSEFMLQQTRVDAVAPYYRRWMQRFPSVAALAQADLGEVLRLWAGLGYYARARNLHAAARDIVLRHGGAVPRDLAALRALPGVGPYTAGAVASIAFGIRASAVDGNVRRVLARLMDDPSPSSALSRRWAEALVDPADPGDFNQALMELGATVCTPRRPSCPLCPVSEHCAAWAVGSQDARPVPTRRRAVPTRVEAVAVLVREGSPGNRRILLRRRPKTGLLASMWELPGAEVEDAGDAPAAALSAAREVWERFGPDAARLRHGAPVALPALDHAFTHRKMRYLPFLLALRVDPEPAAVGGAVGKDGLRWIAEHQTEQVAIPAAQKRLLARAWSW